MNNIVVDLYVPQYNICTQENNIEWPQLCHIKGKGEQVHGFGFLTHVDQIAHPSASS